MIPSKFNGKKFSNAKATAEHGWKEVWKWFYQGKRPQWPSWVNNDIAAKPLQRVHAKEELQITYINHATVLIQTASMNILTDPVYAKRVGPYPWLGIKRRRAPGVAFDDLPTIDWVLISHDHYDHLDIQTLKKLYQRDKPGIITGLKVEKHLPFTEIISLDWWQSHILSPELKVTFTPSQHFSGRWLNDRNQSLWGSFVIEAPGGPIYFAGDTGLGPHFSEINQHFGPMRASLIPIGAFLPLWFMGPVHLSPEDALEAHQILQSKWSLAIHFEVFPLADDAFGQPRSQLQAALGKCQNPQLFEIPEPGQRYTLA